MHSLCTQRRKKVSNASVACRVGRKTQKEEIDNVIGDGRYEDLQILAEDGRWTVNTKPAE